MPWPWEKTAATSWNPTILAVNSSALARVPNSMKGAASRAADASNLQRMTFLPFALIETNADGTFLGARKTGEIGVKCTTGSGDQERYHKIAAASVTEIFQSVRPLGPRDKSVNYLSHDHRCIAEVRQGGHERT